MCWIDLWVAVLHPNSLVTEGNLRFKSFHEWAAKTVRAGAVRRGSVQRLRTHPAIREETALRGFIVETLQKLGIATPEPHKAVGWTR